MTHSKRVRSYRALAVLATMLDFEDPGPVKVFIDERSIRYIEARMNRRGYHTSQEMGSSLPSVPISRGTP